MRRSRIRRPAGAVALALGAAFLGPGVPSTAAAADPYQVLVFSKAAGFRHDSIPAGITAIQQLGTANDFTVTATEDVTAFTPQNLGAYEAVVFLSTTGDVLNGSQQNALKGYVDGGGGFVGVHAAADTEYDWPEYEDLVGAWFTSHPAIQEARLTTEDHVHPATAHLDDTWTRNDEWYDYRSNPRAGVHVLQSLDESSYSGGGMAGDHPITWCHPQQDGRSFYTGLGHTIESFADPDFRQLLLGGIQYAAGAVEADCGTGDPGPDPGPGGDRAEAEAYTSSSGVQAAPHAAAGGGATLGYIDHGDRAGYASLDPAGATAFTAPVSSAGAGGTIEVRAGSATGRLLGSVAVVAPTGGWDAFTEVTTTLTAAAPGAGPLFLRFTGGAGALFDVDRCTLTRAPATEEGGSSDVHLFSYPWYGTPEGPAGSWRHWQQGGGVIVYSWWGRGGYEDSLAGDVLDAAARHGIEVAWHIEPYNGRTAASVVDDIAYLEGKFGDHPAFYRDAAHGDRNAYYVFESLRTLDWSALEAVKDTAIVLAQTTDTTKVAHFGGIYTYDGIAGATAPGWKQAGDYAKANGLVRAPSVAPGYIDDRAVPGNTTPTLGRADGASYDRQWNNALDPAIGGDPTWVSVTSFNEWHEGSSIEPAGSDPPPGHGYETFEGAYGKTGAAAETAYLDRTAYWADRFEQQRR
ncbi:ThuA domain-containing protein [Streptomyces cyaneofuscatus]|uniref:ThuA domain-containing protein n=1 Tax=Streptomyces cyaneofuscatus TaxID=66883 RepID=UPI0037961D5E